MRLGVLGGTYDPIHHGHLLLADQAREALRLDRVLLVPAGRPPHKPAVPVSPYEVRLRMVELALAGVSDLISSDLERDTDRMSFTVGTLRRLRRDQPELEELWLLLGTDSLWELPSWREPGEILRLARLAVYPRPADREDEVGGPGLGRAGSAGPVPGEAPATAGERALFGATKDAQTLENLLSGARVRTLDGPRLRLSSTEIRQRVREQRSIRFLVPEAVRAYILESGLYQGGPAEPPDDAARFPRGEDRPFAR